MIADISAFASASTATLSTIMFSTAVRINGVGIDPDASSTALWNAASCRGQFAASVSPDVKTIT